MRVNSKDGTFEKLWEERNAKLLDRLLVFFDVVATNDLQFDTELANQIGLSAKMFRHGKMAGSYGINYLCAFTALEGLVCGPREFGHGKLLEQRLSTLFRYKNHVVSEVKKLWRFRCEASHQGKAFDDNFSVLIEPVEKLMLGTLIFALHHVKIAKTIDELWDKHASSYNLPSEAIVERPPEVFRTAIVSLVGGPKLKWSNVGLLVDQAFKSQKRI